MNRMRGGRVRLAAANPRGEFFDLEKLFEELNEKYFGGELQRPHIGWSSKTGGGNSAAMIPGPIRFCSIGGWIAQVFPPCAVEYVLFHEMLHVKHPTRRSGCSLVSHSKEFRAEKSVSRSLNEPAAPSTVSRVDLRREITPSRRRRSRVLRRNDCQCGREQAGEDKRQD